jgi:hypothetical protein
MKTLEQEAELYRLNSGNQMQIEKMAFIAGANSKYVQIEKIKAQIDILYQMRNSGLTSTVFKIEEFEQKLKELQR